MNNNEEVKHKFSPLPIVICAEFIPSFSVFGTVYSGLVLFSHDEFFEIKELNRAIF